MKKPLPDVRKVVLGSTQVNSGRSQARSGMQWDPMFSSDPISDYVSNDGLIPPEDLDPHALSGIRSGLGRASCSQPAQPSTAAATSSGCALSPA
ncbi:hypothetical protein DL767_000091 [Monosporascus sp. MG133]|nr:hypothetical protein DL767_000091 [Monosporascus sp. MG133]